MTGEELYAFASELRATLARPIEVERASSVDGYIMVQRCRVCRTVIEPFTIMWSELALAWNAHRWARRIRIDYLRHRCAEPDIRGLDAVEVEILAGDMERDATRLAERAARLMAGVPGERHPGEHTAFHGAVERVKRVMIDEHERVYGTVAEHEYAIHDMARRVVTVLGVGLDFHRTAK